MSLLVTFLVHGHVVKVVTGQDDTIAVDTIDWHLYALTTYRSPISRRTSLPNRRETQARPSGRTRNCCQPQAAKTPRVTMVNQDRDSQGRNQDRPALKNNGGQNWNRANG
jgi:hypothetical protein